MKTQKQKRNLFRTFSILGITTLLGACASIPKHATPVQNFDVDRYLGVWYEIARFDFRFERDLNNVSAQYGLNKNGNVTVLNSGYNYKKQQWKKAEGIAKFRNEKAEGTLKVSFFGPFYSGYNVIALDTDYRHALVAGKNLNYLWILSREKTIPEEVKQNYLQIAVDLGYEIEKLTWVTHDRNNNPFLNED